MHASERSDTQPQMHANGRRFFWRSGVSPDAVARGGVIAVACELGSCLKNTREHASDSALHCCFAIFVRTTSVINYVALALTSVTAPIQRSHVDEIWQNNGGQNNGGQTYVYHKHEFVSRGELWQANARECFGRARAWAPLAKFESDDLGGRASRPKPLEGRGLTRPRISTICGCVLRASLARFQILCRLPCARHLSYRWRWTVLCRPSLWLYPLFCRLLPWPLSLFLQRRRLSRRHLTSLYLLCL